MDSSSDPVLLASQFMAMEIILELLAFTSSGQLPKKLTEQLRELTGARFVLLIAHSDDPAPHEMLYACPSRCGPTFSTGELGLFCPKHTPEDLPRLAAALPTGHPLRTVLLQAGIESLLRFPLYAAGDLIGSLLLLDLPEPKRIEDVTATVNTLLPAIAMSLNNALVHQRMEAQARELTLQAEGLEHRVAEHTAELKNANKALSDSRLAALNMMEDAIAARRRAEETAAALEREIAERRRAGKALHESERKYRLLTENIKDVVWVLDAETLCFRYVSPSAERLRGYTPEEILAQPLTSALTAEDSTRMVSLVRSRMEDLLAGRASAETFYTNEIEQPCRDGSTIWTEVVTSYYVNEENGRVEVRGVTRDITERKRVEQLTKTRLALVEFAAGHTLDELLTRALDEISGLVNSPIGFYHFVESDQDTLSLQQWSTRTLKEFCRVEAKGMHYPIEQAGVWADCVRERKPVVHNDYPSLKCKKGMPEGHAELVRELVVPVIRKNQVVAILGVGNSPTDYTDTDVGIVSYLSDVTWVIVEHKRAEEELRESREQHGTLLQTAMDGFWVANTQGRLLEVNEAYCRMSGYSERELLAMCISDLDADETDDNTATARIQSIMEQREGRVEVRHRRKDGGLFDVEVSFQYRTDGDGRMVAFLRDITERKRQEEEKAKLEAQLHQAQKMESVGRLAGGVAHDFNNMLAVILGYTEVVMGQVDPSQPLHADLQEIRKAASRSADLTRQLLAFARQQTVAPKVLDLNEIVTGMLKMLQRLIGEDIQLNWHPGANLWPVRMDPSQIDQILANLCVNARDAIADVGKVTIQTENLALDRHYCAGRAGFTPGEYVLLTVSDDGCGMNEETQSRIFEPFFTSKGMGKGTGLGLATIYGIVKQNDGFINVYSEVGQGTAFAIYLPRHEGNTEQVCAETAREAPACGPETILLAEDEPALLRMAATMLKSLGYTVLAAGSPGEAIRLAREHRGKIDLLMTDVVMPEMNGRDLAKNLLSLYPQIKRLFMSGYTADVIAHHGVLDEGTHFIQKPFSINGLATKVRETLDDG